MALSLSDLMKMRAEIARRCGGFLDSAVKINHTPGAAGPWGVTVQAAIAIWLPRSVDLGLYRECARSIGERWAPGHRVTVDHDPDSPPVASLTAACACGYANEYNAPSNHEGRWRCTACRLWSTVAGNDDVVKVEFQTSAPVTSVTITTLRCNLGESPNECFCRALKERGIADKYTIDALPGGNGFRFIGVDSTFDVLYHNAP